MNRTADRIPETRTETTDRAKVRDFLVGAGRYLGGAGVFCDRLGVWSTASYEGGEVRTTDAPNGGPRHYVIWDRRQALADRNAAILAADIARIQAEQAQANAREYDRCNADYREEDLGSLAGDLGDMSWP